jgi:hypothetical protein
MAMQGAAIETKDTEIGTRTETSPNVWYYEWIRIITD